MYLDASQVAIKGSLAHCATVSKTWEEIVEDNKVYFRSNAGTITELGDDKGDQLTYFCVFSFGRFLKIPI